jgi:hypothetical protein
MDQGEGSRQLIERQVIGFISGAQSNSEGS